jgi:hypothetical protein
MALGDLEEGVDMLYFNTIESFEILPWHIKQLIEEAENEPTIKPVRLYRNIYLMKPDEEERDVSAEFADSVAKMIAVSEAYCIFLRGKGTDVSFTNKSINLLKSKFRQDYEDKNFREDFIYNPEVLENFQKFLDKYRKIFGLTDF